MFDKLNNLADEYFEFIRKYIVVFVLVFVFLGAFTSLHISFTTVILSLSFLGYLLLNKIKSFRGK